MSPGQAEDEAKAERALLNIKEPKNLSTDQTTEGVWHVNVAAVEAFLEASTQFSVLVTPSGKFRFSGLDYQRARAAWDLSGATITPDLFAKIQIVESSAIAEFNRG